MLIHSPIFLFSTRNFIFYLLKKGQHWKLEKTFLKVEIEKVEKIRRKRIGWMWFMYKFQSLLIIVEITLLPLSFNFICSLVLKYIYFFYLIILLLHKNIIIFHILLNINYIFVFGIFISQLISYLKVNFIGECLIQIINLIPYFSFFDPQFYLLSFKKKKKVIALKTWEPPSGCLNRNS